MLDTTKKAENVQSYQGEDYLVLANGATGTTGTTAEAATTTAITAFHTKLNLPS